MFVLWSEGLEFFGSVFFSVGVVESAEKDFDVVGVDFSVG